MNYINSLLFAILFWQSYAALSVVDYRDRNEFGNKTANLASIEEVLKKLREEKRIPVYVPPYMGIGHSEAKNFLTDKKAYEHLLDAWKNFKQHQNDQRELTESGKEALLTIRMAIGKALNDNFYLKNDRNIDLNSFLEDAQKKKLRLMVRSTGREDSKELANAGGNESIANVEPTIEAVTAAMAKVLESYFGEKSFNQRIAAGERPESLFGDPFLPVLLQVMIGEKEGRIPTSGVAFSQEILGNTPLVVAIDATFGHGEAVVNSIYPTDTYYIGRSSLIHPIIRIKHTRLAPKPDGFGLIPKENDLKIQRASSLSPLQISYLAEIARALEADRDEPIDMEFVVLDDIIYVVQVRPIVEAANKPSYLRSEFVNKIANEKQVAIVPIVSGGGETKIILSEHEVIIADKIRTALDIYLDKKKSEQDKIALVVSGENAPQTSHEATTFRSNNKAVVYARDIALAKKLLSNNLYRLADVQRGKLYLSSSFTEADVKTGWLKHPIPELVSIHREFLPKKILAEKFDDPSLSNVGLSGLIDLIRYSRSQNEATSGIFTLRARLSKQISIEEDRQEELKRQGSETNPELITRLNVIYRHIEHASDEALRALDAYFNIKGEKSDKDELLRLYPTNFLSALIRQVPEDKDVINPYSVGFLLKVEHEEQSLINALKLAGKEARGYAVQYARAGKYALTDDVRIAWGRFLSNFEEVFEKPAFARMMIKLAQLNILPSWLNMVFYLEQQKGEDANALASHLVAQFNNEQELVERIFDLKKKLAQFPLNQLGNPKQFLKNQEDFSNEVLDKALDTQFLTAIKNGSILAKSSGSAFLNQVVQAFDDGIKGLTGSQEYPSSIEKTEALGEILNTYLSALRSIASNLLDETKDAPELLNQFDLKIGIAGYLKQIEDLLKASLARAKRSEEDAKRELLPTSDFNADAAKLGSLALWSRSIGRAPSLEDIFSLIHQNLLVIIGRLSASLPWDKFPLPPLVRDLESAMQRLEIYSSIYSRSGQTLKAPNLVGASLSEEELRLFFNQPLFHHSNTFEIAYSLRNQKTTLRARFLGQAHGRWQFIAGVIRSILPLKGLAPASVPFVDHARGLLEFTWDIDHERQIKLAKIALSEFGNLANRFPTEKELALKNLTSFRGKIKPRDVTNICKNELLELEHMEDVQIALIKTLVETFPPDLCKDEVREKTNAIDQAIEAAKRLFQKGKNVGALRLIYAISFFAPSKTTNLIEKDNELMDELIKYGVNVLTSGTKGKYFSIIETDFDVLSDLLNRVPKLAINILMQPKGLADTFYQHQFETSQWLTYLELALEAAGKGSISDEQVDAIMGAIVEKPTEDIELEKYAMWFIDGLVRCSSAECKRLFDALERVFNKKDGYTITDKIRKHFESKRSLRRK